MIQLHKHINRLKTERFFKSNHLVLFFQNSNEKTSQSIQNIHKQLLLTGQSNLYCIQNNIASALFLKKSQIKIQSKSQAKELDVENVLTQLENSCLEKRKSQKLIEIEKGEGEKHSSLAQTTIECTQRERKGVKHKQLFHAQHLLIGVKGSLQVENLLKILCLRLKKKVEKKEEILFLGGFYNNQILNTNQIMLLGSYCQKEREDFNYASMRCMQNPAQHLLHNIEKPTFDYLFAMRFTACQLLDTLRYKHHLLEALER